MMRLSSSTGPGRRFPLVSGVVLLAFALVGCIWAASYFGAEARMRRATTRVVRLVQKEGEESPVALGLSARRLGNHCSTHGVLELQDYGPLASGRTEIVQLYANLRNSADSISFDGLKILSTVLPDGQVQVFVEGQYRLVVGGESRAGDGKATLLWAKGDDGWQIAQATLALDPAEAKFQGWP